MRPARRKSAKSSAWLKWCYLGAGGAVLLGILVAITVWAVGGTSIPTGPETQAGRERNEHPAVAEASKAPAGGQQQDDAAEPAPATDEPPAEADSQPTPQTDSGGGQAASSSPTGLKPGVGRSPKAAAPARPVTVGMPGAAQAMDVLREINPQRDSLQGTWALRGTALLSPRNKLGVLRLPIAALQEYRLTIVAERLLGSDALHIGLSVDGYPTTLLLDDWQARLSGLNLVAGKRADQNGTAYRGAIFQGSQPATIICTVSPGSVNATVDGRTIVHWAGQSKLLSADMRFGSENTHDLLISVVTGQFRISRIECVSLSGPPPRLEPPPAFVAAGSTSTKARPGEPEPPYVPPSFTVSPESIRSVALIEHPMASGSGFAVGKNLVVTNAHVVDGAFPDEIRVIFEAEARNPLKVSRMVSFDKARDLCILEVANPSPGLPVRAEYTFHVGDETALVGNPAVSAHGGMLLRNAVNHGKFINLVRISRQDFYQIEASVNPGWSGGPVLDAEGKVIAVVAMKIDERHLEEIKGAMKRLDETFRARAGTPQYAAGLTYGIPANALGKMLADPALHDKDRQAKMNDKYAARILSERLYFLGGLTMLRMLLNVPDQARTEARGPIQLKKPTELVPLIPEHEADSLTEKLDQEEGLRSIEKKFNDHLEERIAAIQESANLAGPVKRDLAATLRKIRDGEKYAENPTGGYIAFSGKVLGFSHDVKRLIKHVRDGLREKGQSEGE
jgi:S1-C subfamily serine protease